MKQNVDITGKRFGRLTAIASAGKSACWVEVWKCRCDCGREVFVYKTHLMSGHTKSCGCLRAEKVGQANRRRYGKKVTMGSCADGGEK